MDFRLSICRYYPLLQNLIFFSASYFVKCKIQFAFQDILSYCLAIHWSENNYDSRTYIWQTVFSFCSFRTTFGKASTNFPSWHEYSLILSFPFLKEYDTAQRPVLMRDLWSNYLLSFNIWYYLSTERSLCSSHVYWKLIYSSWNLRLCHKLWIFLLDEVPTAEIEIALLKAMKKSKWQNRSSNRGSVWKRGSETPVDITIAKSKLVALSLFLSHVLARLNFRNE